MATVTEDIQEIARTGIPGYDPWGTAEHGQWFDGDAAQTAIEFVEECCTHVKGSLGGTPLLLEDWQKAIVANLFGWKQASGFRRYRECLVYIPRGNSKTTMAAAFVNLVLFLDKEPGAECYSAAAEREQARLCFEVVEGMIRQKPELEKRAEIFKHSLTVGGKSYKALSAEAGSKHGFNVHLVVIDELHAHKTPELTEILLTGMGKRVQPLGIHLTTADYDRESICNTKYDYAKRILAGSIQDSRFLPVIYEASREDDWTDPEVWAKANPNIGVSVPVDYLERECQRAKDDPGYLNTFLRLHLNVKTQSNIAVIDLQKWDRAQDRRDLSNLEGQICYGGLDISSRQDITAFTLNFMDDPCHDVFSWFWVPRAAAERRRRDTKNTAAYHKWEQQGFLEFVDGECVEQDLIFDRITGLTKRFNIKEIAYDPWNCEALRQRLEKERVKMIEFQQSARNFNEPMKAYLAAILEGRVRHGGNPVLRWMAGNLVATQDPNENIRPNKKESSDKIDGQVAAIMGFARAEMSRGKGQPRIRVF